MRKVVSIGVSILNPYAVAIHVKAEIPAQIPDGAHSSFEDGLTNTVERLSLIRCQEAIKGTV